MTRVWEEGLTDMIMGVHVAVQSKDDAADKAFFAKVLKFPYVDAGSGRLIFAAPADIMLHESDENSVHQLFLMCTDMDDFVTLMEKHGVPITKPANRGWGTVAEITLPGGGKLNVYQPHHKRPKLKAAAKKPAKPKTKKPKAKKRR